MAMQPFGPTGVIRARDPLGCRQGLRNSDEQDEQQAPGSDIDDVGRVFPKTLFRGGGDRVRLAGGAAFRTDRKSVV